MLSAINLIMPADKPAVDSDQPNVWDSQLTLPIGADIPTQTHLFASKPEPVEQGFLPALWK